MSRVNANCIRPPVNPAPPNYVPPGGILHRVTNNDSWDSLARDLGMDAWALIRYNYPNLPADKKEAALEVNWYLQEYVGCNVVTNDKKNYKFSLSAQPGRIYLPKTMTSSIYHPVPGMSQPKDALCWYASLQMVVSYYRHRGLGHGLIDPSEDPETRDMYNKNQGIEDRERIARKLGFSVLYESLTEAKMWEMLNNGPVIYAGEWPGQASGHWVVIVGISGRTIAINDPWSGPTKWDYRDFMEKVLRQTAERPLIYVP